MTSVVGRMWVRLSPTLAPGGSSKFLWCCVVYSICVHHCSGNSGDNQYNNITNLFVSAEWAYSSLLTEIWKTRSHTLKGNLFSLSKIYNAFPLLSYCQICCSYCGYDTLTLAPRAPQYLFRWPRTLDQEYSQHILDTQSLFLRYCTFEFYFITPWLLSPFYNSLYCHCL